MLVTGMLVVVIAGIVGWRDDFDGPELAARWQLRRPVEGPTVSLTDSPGWLRVVVPQRKGGYNHWVTAPGCTDAPLLAAEAPEGNFAFETRVRVVQFGPASNFHLAAVVGFSPGYVLAWGPFRAPVLAGAPKDDPELWAEPTGFGGFLKVPPPARDLYLRIERRGEAYALLYKRNPEENWTKAGEYHAFARPSFVGFLGKTFGDGEAVAFEVDYAAVEDLAEAEVPRALLRIGANGAWPLDVRRYSHFIEHLGKCIYQGLWAEKLYNRKFTGSEEKGVVEGWRPVGDERAVFAADVEDWYVPCQSQRIEVAGGEEAGVAQGPVSFRAGVAHEGYVLAKCRPAGLRLRVVLAAGDRTLAEAALGPLSEQWQKYSFTLPALGETVSAEVRIMASGPGTVWLGAASLMPADNLDGWRRDVIEVLRAVRPAAIRWPGGNFASQYDWKEGIGERDRRPCRWNRAWNQWEWNDVGTDEFLRLCELLGAEPYICANAGEGTPQEAAEWVEYCNGPPDSPMGRLRAANGHPAPYGVRLWGLGNEMYGNWQHGWLDGTKYGLKAAQMASAMRAIDSTLQLVLVGVDGRGWDNFNEKALRKAGGSSDYLSVHYYLGLDVNADQLAEYARAIAAAVDVERMLQDTWEIARQGNGGKPIPVCFDEWNVWRAEVDDQPGYKGFYCLREGLFAGEILNALNRLGPKVPIACVTQSVNVLGLIRVNETTVAPTPSYWVLKLFRDRAGKVGLPVEYEGPTAVFAHLNLPLIDATATYDPDARRLSVLMVNRSVAEACQVAIEVPWAEQLAVREVEAVTADDYLAANDYARPDVVVARRMPDLARADGNRAEVTVPKHSVVAVDLGLTNPKFGG